MLTERIFADRQSHGVGMILRNSSGDTLAFKAIHLRGCPEARTCEAIALREALTWLQGSEDCTFIIETDSQTVCNSIESLEEDDTEFGDVIKQCRLMLNPSRLIRHVRRTVNEAAHVLARQSISLDTPLVGVTPPIWLNNALRCIYLNIEH